MKVSDNLQLFINEGNLTGCGQHGEAVLKNIALENRCTCKSIKQKTEPRQHQQRSSQFQYLTGLSHPPYR